MTTNIQRIQSNFMLLNDTLDKNFMKIYKSFIDEQENKLKLEKVFKKLKDNEDVSLSNPDS